MEEQPTTPVVVPAFKPSQVRLDLFFPPLPNTFEKTEAEVAAVVLVRASQENGDTWAPLTDEVVTRTILQDLDKADSLIGTMARNPFLTPDFQELHRRGYTKLDAAGCWSFTALAYERLARWVR